MRVWQQKYDRHNTEKPMRPCDALITMQLKHVKWKEMQTQLKQHRHITL